VDDLTPAERQSLREILEIHAIQQVMLQYTRAIDRNDADAMATIFWPEGLDNHGMYDGTASGFMERSRTNRDLITSRYHILGPVHVLAFEANQAKVETYFHYVGVFPDPGPEDTIGHLAGRYRDVFEKRAGTWKVLRRLVIFDSATSQPYEPAWDYFAIPEGINRGKTEPFDASYLPAW